MNLHTFLNDHERVVYRVPQPLSVDQEITALQHALEKRGERPIVLIEKPKLRSGEISPLPVVCNLTASRDLVAGALGIDDHREFARVYEARRLRSIPPERVAGGRAPCQEIVLRGEEIDLRYLPALIQHDLAPGPYLTGAHVTTFDPDTGTDNSAIQRCWIKHRRLLSLYTYPASHNARNVKKFWSRGQPCPVCLWIGHHPAVEMGAQAKIPYSESHWQAASSFVGQPLSLVPSITHGEKLPVPAEAEIVIEGWVPCGRLDVDGPFGEYTGYVGPQTLASVIEVSCVTRRREAIYHDYASGLPDMLIPDNLMMEAKLFGMIKAVCLSMTRVHVPDSGRRFHAYVQVEKPGPGEARDALLAALAYRRVKMGIVVDSDVDLYDEREMMWALATRVQWHRDLITVEGLSTSSLDPSLPKGASTTTKIGIDATLAPSELEGVPAPHPPRIHVREEALARAESILAGADRGSWPKG
jgi:UbiD family decarboxylase